MFRLALLTLFFLPAAVSADEAQIRRAVESRIGAARIEGIQPSPVSGLWEVRVRTARGFDLIYSDPTGSYLVQGHIFDLKTERDLTEDKLRKLNAIRFDTLPLDQAVKIQRGNGKRILAMFSDPYCPACKQFEQTLQEIDNITVYVFMYPVIRPELSEQSKAVWCSPDRGKAWLDLALRGKRPTANASCEGPVEKNLLLGRSLSVNATPTLILANGERFSGGLAASDLKDLLDQVATAR